MSHRVFNLKKFASFVVSVLMHKHPCHSHVHGVAFRLISFLLFVNILVAMDVTHAATKDLFTQNDFKYIGSFVPPLVGNDYYSNGFACAMQMDRLMASS